MILSKYFNIIKRWFLVCDYRLVWIEENSQKAVQNVIINTETISKLPDKVFMMNSLSKRILVEEEIRSNNYIKLKDEVFITDSLVPCDFLIINAALLQDWKDFIFSNEEAQKTYDLSVIVVIIPSKMDSDMKKINDLLQEIKTNKFTNVGLIGIYGKAADAFLEYIWRKNRFKILIIPSYNKFQNETALQMLSFMFVVILSFCLINFHLYQKCHKGPILHDIFINDLIKVQFRELDKKKYIEKNCLICFERFEDEKELFLLFCDHYFHIKCLKYWLTKKSSKCPLCRKPVLFDI